MKRLLRIPFRFPFYQLLPERISGSFVKAACLDDLLNGFHLVVCEQVIGFPTNLVGQAFTGRFFRGGIDRSGLVRRGTLMMPSPTAQFAASTA